MTENRDEVLRRIIREVLDEPGRNEDRKRILKEAISEWLDSQWAIFGKWTFRGIVAMATVALLYLYAKVKGVL